MARLRHPRLTAEAARRNRELTAKLGGELRNSRVRRHLTQAGLAEKIDVAQSTVSLMERGGGGSSALDLWQRAFVAVDRRLELVASTDPLRPVADAGHLAIQDLVLRQARAAGFAGTFELATRPADPSRSADVGLRDDRRALLVLVECWNMIGDIGAAARATSRKVAEAGQLAVAIGQGAEHRVGAVWVVRATRRNVELVRQYPEVFAARFPGSSDRWVRALTVGQPPPVESGMVWCDVRCSRLYAWRQGMKRR